MIGRVLLFSVSAFLVGGLGIYLASRGEDSFIRHDRRTKFISYFCIVHIVLFCAFLGTAVISGLMLAIFGIGAYELYRVISHANAVPIPLRTGIEVGYLVLSFGLLVFVSASPGETIVFVYLVVAAFDGFSQVAGQLFGEHLLAPLISPGKTIEGALGGAVAAGFMAALLRPLVNLTAVQSIGACCWIVLGGLLGDLLASWVKRKGGVKDFGALLPGQGGILDRFDSFLLAGPISFFALHHPRL
jgi:phosphatidate cytidylyltransferase